MHRKPKIHYRWLGLLACLVALAVPSLVFAGGWAVITLDELPQDITAGQPVTIGLMARQHGQTPWVVEEIIIEAKHLETGRKVSFAAKPDGTPGHYQAELVFPEAGRWAWSVASGLMPMQQPLPALEVAGNTAMPAVSRNTSPFNALRTLSTPAVLLGIAALGVFAAGIALVVRSQNNKRRLLAGAVSLVLCGALAFAMFAFGNVQAQQEAPAGETPTMGAETGQQLFLAKGCVVCHTNDRAIAVSAQYGVDFGPNLTRYSNDPDYLRKFLADPQAVKKTTNMPDLGLSEAEIEALVSFINDHE